MSREQKSRANDEAIHSALIQVVSVDGWDNATVSSVAKKAKVSVGAIYTRAENLPELANQVWSTTLKSYIVSFFEVLLDALEAQDSDKLIDLSRNMEQHQIEYSVALELIIASLFDDELEEVIGQDFRQLLCEATQKESSVQSAAATLASGLLIGQALARRRSAVGVLTRRDANLLCSYWRSGLVGLDTARQMTLAPYRAPSGEDQGRSARAILSVIAKRGYRKATVSRLARAQGMTPGAIFAGHKSKADLVGQAAQEVLLTPIQLWEQYGSLMDAGTSPLARALFLREYMHPRHEEYWKIALELARVGESFSELEEFRTPRDALQRTHIAMALIASFSPHAWKLPFYGPFLQGTAT